MSALNLIERGRTEFNSDNIVGISPALRSILAEVERVAPTDATVLVLGETGTGKELIARAIHNLSLRSKRPFVKLDCATIPFDRLESEIFGHEKGASPWAIAQKIGRFEMADTGTLFLDEIGDLPLALQPKLLRILQEQEFERPGSIRKRHANVRLVAATNRDLAHMVRHEKFRRDLYYRLNGFPVLLPPLRERGEDIALLVSHFVAVFSRRMGKRIHTIPEATLSAFTSHSWPGNVRELKNSIERAVILSNDGVLPNLFPMPGRHSTPATSHVVRPDGPPKAVTRSKAGALPSLLPAPEGHAFTAALMFGHELKSTGASSDLPIVFVVDDDISARESIKLLVRREGWQSETFAFARDFLDRPRPHVPNCLILDDSLQDISGLDMQKRIVAERTETAMIFITGHGDVPTSVQAMKAGAVEFLIKPFRDKALVDAIREALRRSSISLGREAEMRLLRDRYASLSHREREVMALVLSGLLNKQVGAELGISEITVKAHRGRVMQKMRAKSVVDLVRMATRLRSERAFLASSQFKLPSPSSTITSSICTMTVPASPGRIALVAQSGRS